MCQYHYLHRPRITTIPRIPAACSHIGTLSLSLPDQFASFFQQGPLFVHRLKSRNQRQKNVFLLCACFSKRDQNFQLIVAFSCIHIWLDDVGSTPQDSSGICVCSFKRFNWCFHSLPPPCRTCRGSDQRSVCHQNTHLARPFPQKPRSIRRASRLWVTEIGC